MVVQHNLTAMNSNRMLGLTTSAQAKSTEKLSSGYKINRAADDAAGLSISEKMRKQIRGLSQASLNAQDGISSVQTAEGALNEVQDMLQRMNELAVKAANGTMSEDDRSYIQDEIKQLETEIDRVAETTKFNETYLLKGDVLAEKTYTASMVEANKATSFEALREGIKFYKKGEVDALTEEEAKAELANGGKLYTDAAAVTTQPAGKKAVATTDFTIAKGTVENAGFSAGTGGSASDGDINITDKVKNGTYTYDGTDWKDANGNVATGITVINSKTVGTGATFTVTGGAATIVGGKKVYAENGFEELTADEVLERYQAGENLYTEAATIDTTKAQTEAVADTDYKFENATTATGDLTKTAGVNFYKKDGTTALTDDEIKAELANGNKVYTTSAAQKQDDTNKATDGNGYTYVARNAASSNAGLTNVTADESLAAGVYTFDGTDWTDEKGNKVGADKFTYTGTAVANDTITITDEHVTFTNPVYAEGGSAALTDAEILKAHKAGETLHTVAAQKEAVSGKDYTYKADDSFGLYDVNGNKISSNALDSYFDIDDKGVATLKEGKTLYTDNKRTVLKDADISKYVSTEQSMTAALELKLHVGADATSNNQISLKIDSMSAESLGVKDLKVDGADDKNALEAIETIKAAIQKVSKQRSALGAVQNRLEHTISNLDNVVENTTSAESQIRDTDMATEMVKYSNNNILAQAGQSMLAQANQSNQGVLSLLG